MHIPDILPLASTTSKASARADLPAEIDAVADEFHILEGVVTVDGKLRGAYSDELFKLRRDLLSATHGSRHPSLDQTVDGADAIVRLNSAPVAEAIALAAAVSTTRLVALPPALYSNAAHDGLPRAFKEEISLFQADAEAVGWTPLIVCPLDAYSFEKHLDAPGARVHAGVHGSIFNTIGLMAPMIRSMRKDISALKTEAQALGVDIDAVLEQLKAAAADINHAFRQQSELFRRVARQEYRHAQIDHEKNISSWRQESADFWSGGRRHAERDENGCPYYTVSYTTGGHDGYGNFEPVRHHSHKVVLRHPPEEPVEAAVPNAPQPLAVKPRKARSLPEHPAGGNLEIDANGFASHMAVALPPGVSLGTAAAGDFVKIGPSWGAGFGPMLAGSTGFPIPLDREILP